MANNFTSVMAKRSDLELIAIVTTQRDDYQEEALAAAEAEIAARNLTFERWHEAEAEVRRVDVDRTNRASEPLDGGWKALLFFFPGLLTLAAAHKYKRAATTGSGRTRSGGRSTACASTSPLRSSRRSSRPSRVDCDAMKGCRFCSPSPRFDRELQSALWVKRDLRFHLHVGRSRYWL